jgi:hypothetical protein
MVAIPTHKAHQIERDARTVMVASSFIGEDATKYPPVDDGFAKLLTVIENWVPGCIALVVYLNVSADM